METLARYLFHWTPERAIWLGGQTLSWDARCAGIYAGFGITLLLHLLLYRQVQKQPPRSVLVAAAVLVLPFIFDVITTRYGLRPPVNAIKHLTGAWFGCVFCCLLYPTVRRLMHADREAPSPTLRSLALMAAASAALSGLTQWDHRMAYYLLESLAWLGFGGLGLLMMCGLVLSLRKQG